MFEHLENYCEPVNPVYLRFGMKNFGFGELSFRVQGDKIYCENELMSKETIKKILNIMVDNCELMDV